MQDKFNLDHIIDLFFIAKREAIQKKLDRNIKIAISLLGVCLFSLFVFYNHFSLFVNFLFCLPFLYGALWMIEKIKSDQIIYLSFKKEMIDLFAASFEIRALIKDDINYSDIDRSYLDKKLKLIHPIV